MITLALLFTLFLVIALVSIAYAIHADHRAVKAERAREQLAGELLVANTSLECAIRDRDELYETLQLEHDAQEWWRATA